MDDLLDNLREEIGLEHILLLQEGERWHELARHYPFSEFSRLMWEYVEDAEVYSKLAAEPSNSSTREYLLGDPSDIEGFLREKIGHTPICHEPVLWLGDDVNYCLQMTGEVFLRCWERILCWPMHHYLVPLNLSWCLNFTMESDLYFGYSEKVRLSALRQSPAYQYPGLKELRLKRMMRGIPEY